MRDPVVTGAGRVVVKVGSAVLARAEGQGVDEPILDALCDGIAELRRQGRTVLVVSSGAVALGLREMGMTVRPRSLTQRQALAAVGQTLLMRAWRDSLRRHELKPAQVLLTHDDLNDRKRYLNARHTVQAILQLGAIPVVNENDTVAVEEIKLGDNDNLSAQVSTLAGADLLVILSVFDGLYDQDPVGNPDARRIALVERVDASVEKLGAGGVSSLGTGGMVTKLQAARTATRFGTATVITAGRAPNVLERVMGGEDLGTLFLPQGTPVRGRKHWLAFTRRRRGTIVVDAGAASAIASLGKSLLPSGIVAISGTFETGDAIGILDPTGREIARGLTAYSSDEVRRIAGQRTDRIESVLGYRYSPEVVHRDDLVVL